MRWSTAPSQPARFNRAAPFRERLWCKAAYPEGGIPRFNRAAPFRERLYDRVGVRGISS